MGKLSKQGGAIACIGLCFLALINSDAQDIQKGKKISPDLFGLFFEDINYAADGGLYAELVQNRSFEYNPAERREWHPLSYWEYMDPGFSYGRISVETKSPVHPNNPHYIVLDIEHVGHEEQFTGEAGVGLKNSGFDGIVIRKEETYNFSLFAQQLSDDPVGLLVSLQDPDGQVLAQSTIATSSGTWQKYTITLRASAGSDSASLVILAKNPGKLAVDMISLHEPTQRAQGRPGAYARRHAPEIYPLSRRLPGAWRRTGKHVPVEEHDRSR